VPFFLEHPVKCLFNQFSRGAGADEVMFHEHLIIPFHPFGQISFPIVMSHQSNILGFPHDVNPFLTTVEYVHDNAIKP
jgi:hypothetical protein